tara:strand:+ start:3103 stop:4542 length:1440 start_codon:yes stop_codon:yes gene_type:complete
MNLDEIIKNIKFKGTPDEREIYNIVHDSRKVKEGSLFIAIAGENNDGHDYIFDAIDKGATAVIANGRSPITNRVPIIQVKNPRKAMSKISANFYNNPSKKINIIGVTGTNGKTTTTQLVDYILKYNKLNSGSLGTLGFSSPTGIISTGFTTPESVDLQQIIRTMADGGIKYIPIEISSHAIKLHRVDDIDVNIAIFTNLTVDHLDFHGNMENYFNTKLKLFKKLNKNSIAIINGDDKYSKGIIDNIRCEYLTFGFNKKFNLYVKSYNLSIDGTKITFNLEGKEFEVKTELIGEFNIYNIMGSILASWKLGLNINQIQYALKSFKSVPGRFEKFKLKNKNNAIVDYAHTPDAFENILSNINKLTKKDIITVFGCGGNRDKTKRAKMGEIAERYSSYIYLTNDNPRFENENSIIDDIIKGLKNEKYSIIKNRSKALHEILQKYSNKIIVILGKGRDDYQIIRNNKEFHSDIGIVEEYLDEN